MRRHALLVSVVLTFGSLILPVASAAAATSSRQPANVAVTANGDRAYRVRADDSTQLVVRRPLTAARSQRVPQKRPSGVACGQVITENTTLTADVGPCDGDGIIIGSDNIRLNLNGRRVFGNSDRGAGGEFAGIRVTSKTGVTLMGATPGGAKRGKIAGFEAGIVIDGGSANIIRNLIVQDNVGRDDAFNAELGDGIVLLGSPLNRIIDNVINHNGIFDGIGVLGGEADNNMIKGNIVEDTLGPSDEGPAGQGIIVNAASLGLNDGAVIVGSVVEANFVRGNGSAGISNTNSVDTRIIGNVVRNNGLRNLFGHGIGLSLGPRAAVDATRALVKDNEVHGNGVDGINVNLRSTGNRIVNNNAANNNKHSLLRQGRGFDLHDVNQGVDPDTGLQRTDCADNVWKRNSWGSGLFSPQCVTAGGHGPPLPPPGPEGPFGNPTCSDQLDNDRDGLTDAYDSGCEPPPEGPVGDPTCSDGIDNDFDGNVDLEDPACFVFVPDREASVPNDPGCSDGIDNDQDGLIDSADPDCLSVGEGRPASRECNDGLDNDRDGLIDSADPDCKIL